MNLPELGLYIAERIDNRLVAFSLRCLGFTAVGLELLLDEVYDGPNAQERWNIHNLEERQDMA